MQRSILVLALSVTLSACAAGSSPELTKAKDLCASTEDGRYDLAVEEACGEVIANARSSQDRAVAHNNRGIIYRRADRDQEALADFQEAIRLQPNFTGAYNNRGVIYSKLGEDERAVQSFKTAIRLLPLSPKAYNNYAWHLATRGDYAAALTEAEKAQMRAGENDVVYDTKAHALMGLGQQVEAEEAFVRAMELGGSGVVTEYQEALMRKGYDPGGVDGELDAKTREALAACIRDNCRLLLD